MKVSLFLSSLLVAAVSAGVPRTLTTLQATDETPVTAPSTLSTSYPSTSTEPHSEEAQKKKEEEEEEERRVGVNGWLAAPTQAPVTPSGPKTEPPPKREKPGLCESPKGFGIKCMTRMDQCKHDQGCPGVTKCCMVGECGYLCVKPKPTSDVTKGPTKEAAKKKKEGAKEGNKEEGVKEDQENKENQGQQEEITAEERTQDIPSEKGENDAGNGQVTPEQHELESGDEENVPPAAPTDLDSTTKLA